MAHLREYVRNGANFESGRDREQHRPEPFVSARSRSPRRHRTPPPRDYRQTADDNRFRRPLPYDEADAKDVRERQYVRDFEHRNSHPHARHHDDRERFRSPPRGLRRQRSSSPRDYRGHSPRGRRDGSPDFGDPPNREIMLDQLAPDIVEEDITDQLRNAYGLEDVEHIRLIRNKDTRSSRCLAFVTFGNLATSKHFMKQHFPSIHLYSKVASDKESARVRIRYSRGKDDSSTRLRPNWICKNCSYENFPSRHRCHRCQQYADGSEQLEIGVHGAHLANNGDSDVAPDGRPSHFIILRGLGSSVTEQILLKGVTKLLKPAPKPSSPPDDQMKRTHAKVQSTTGDGNLGAKDGSLIRVMLVKNRGDNQNCGYGFAEFATTEDAQAAIQRHMSFDNFTIASKSVMADYIHAGVFVPAATDFERQSRFTFIQAHNPDVKFVYWDQHAWLSELQVGTSEHPQASESGGAPAAEADKDVNKDTKTGDAKIKKRKADVNESTKSKKTMPAHLQFWSDRHAELHGGPAATKDIPDGNHSDGDDTGHNAPSETPAAVNDSASSNSQQSYANMAKKCCYLCSRQFKTETEVNNHERLSDLHRKNLDDSELVRRAHAKLSKAGLGSASQQPTEGADDGYRDRAKERRQIYGTPSSVKSENKTRISLPMKKASEGFLQRQGSSQDSNAHHHRGDDHDNRRLQGDDSTSPAPSKGAALLGKMGWKAGEALGAHGGNKGLSAPIETDLYVEGVGLGAQGGKVGDAVSEAGRNTRGDYGEWTAQGKDRARERFEKM